MAMTETGMFGLLPKQTCVNIINQPHASTGTQVGRKNEGAEMGSLSKFES
jgi:hypothetical protein